MKEVVVTRKGQTTIPAEYRKKYGIKEGARLIVQDVEDGILLTPVPSFIDYAGTGDKAGKEVVKGLKETLDKMRSEGV
ncbi:MAG: AbrB/MazE/SpoVT family DNA-binding domain-containing protein [Candidatus Geothermarchaeales archaeon]